MNNVDQGCSVLICLLPSDFANATVERERLTASPPFLQLHESKLGEVGAAKLDTT